MSLSRQIKKHAKELGFELVGIAPVQAMPELNFYKDWIEAGYAGEMTYLERNVEKKLAITQVVPEAKSVVVCAKIYHTDHPLSITEKDPARGWISRYSWGDDYHDLIKKQLFELSEFIEKASPQPFYSRAYTDTGPIVDRIYAKYAGIGWFGKNTCIINQQIGSWFFLGEVITNLELEYDEPAPDRCGTCTRCIEACPTDAILEPYILDATKCISYLTIELKNDIPVELREGIGNHVFGCDICQDVCPWNSKAVTTEDSSYQPRAGLVNPDLEEMINLSPDEFSLKFRKSPIKRSKYKGFMRNVLIAIGNSAQTKFLPILERLRTSEEPLIARHARWAFNKISKNTS